MGGNNTELTGPDFGTGVNVADVPEGAPLLGHAHGEAVVLVRRGKRSFRRRGLVHALRRAARRRARRRRHDPLPLAPRLLQLCAPARRSPRPRSTRRLLGRSSSEGDKLVRGRSKKDAPAPRSGQRRGPTAIVIVGGGAAGHAAAEMLRREGYDGHDHACSSADAGASGRPAEPLQGLPRRQRARGVDPAPPAGVLRRATASSSCSAPRVTAIDPARRRVAARRRRSIAYDALAARHRSRTEPARRAGRRLPHVHYLRTLADSRAIIAASKSAKRAVVIGVELHRARSGGVAARARARGARRRARSAAARAGDGRRDRRLRARPPRRARRRVPARTTPCARSRRGKSRSPAATTLDADLVVVGIGVQAARRARREGGARGRSRHRGRRVPRDERARRFRGGRHRPLARSALGARLRVEHWVVAERQGQIAARNMLGQRRAFARSCPSSGASTTTYRSPTSAMPSAGIAPTSPAASPRETARSRSAADEKTLAVITIGRDHESLEAEVAFEHGNDERLARFGAS